MNGVYKRQIVIFIFSDYSESIVISEIILASVLVVIKEEIVDLTDSSAKTLHYCVATNL